MGAIHPTINIRTAIVELLEGTIGTVRTVPANLFLANSFINDPGRRAKLVVTVTHQFDVEFGAQQNNADTPTGHLGNTRIMNQDITVRAWRRLLTTPEITLNQLTLADFATDMDWAARSLSYPGNLTETSASAATDIVSGMMHGPGGFGFPQVTPVEADWDELEMTATIEGTLIVQHTLATS